MVESASLNVDYGQKQVNFRYCVRARYAGPEQTAWLNKIAKPYRWFYSAGMYYFTTRKNATWFSLAWV